MGVFAPKNSEKFEVKLRSLQPYFEYIERLKMYDSELNNTYFIVFIDKLYNLL